MLLSPLRQTSPDIVLSRLVFILAQIGVSQSDHPTLFLNWNKFHTSARGIALQYFHQSNWSEIFSVWWSEIFLVCERFSEEDEEDALYCYAVFGM